METLIHADIFFFITTIAVILVSAVLVWGGVYAVRIMRDVKDITKIAKDETERVADDIADLRIDLKREGNKLIDRVGIFSRFFTKVGRKKRITKHHGKKETEGN